MSSPVIVQATRRGVGPAPRQGGGRRLLGRALGLAPGMRFDLLCVLAGVDGVVVLHYRGAGGRLAAEVFDFDADAKVARAAAHYAV